MSARRSPGWVTNQHGAWAMLASPLLLGALARGLDWVHLPLALSWFTGYFAFFAASLWLKSRRRPRFLRPVQVYAAAAAVLGALTAWLAPGLIWAAPAFVLPLGVGLWAAAHRRERDLLAGLTTVLGSALMTIVAYAAPGADSLAAGLALDAAQARRAGLLALGQLLYFGGTVFYVKSMIRKRGDVHFYWTSIAVHAGATVLLCWLAPWLALVFVALTVRAWWVPRRRLSPKQIGIAEIGPTVAVALVSLLTIG
ncbi:MAG: hypothetical protein CSA84_03170 [Actinomycetales bacterium]|nr:MAG: hypothetical protein CSA84_03170 [Actinomycetales bacterium]